MKHTIIGLTGQIGAGKSTVAEHLIIRHGFNRISFAQPLKSMMAVIGVPWKNLHGTTEEKAEPLDLLCGRSARDAMQKLGTEWGRELIGDDLWRNIWQQRVLESHYSRIVVDDVRFVNEQNGIIAMGGKIFCIVRPKLEPKAQHKSENQLLLYDDLLVNSGTIDDLHSRIDKII